MPGFNTNLSADALDIEGNAAVTLAFSGTATHTTVLAEGTYYVWADIACYLKVATTANDVTVANGLILRANTTGILKVRQGSKIGAIGGGAGTLSYHRVG